MKLNLRLEELYLCRESQDYSHSDCLEWIKSGPSFLVTRSVIRPEFISWRENTDKKRLEKNFYCSKDLIFRHYRVE